MKLTKKQKIYLGIALLVLLVLFFAPATCNGITYYRGLRGCSTSQTDNSNQGGRSSYFFNLL